MRNNKTEALNFLRNNELMNNPFIDYEAIALYLVKYASACGNQIDLGLSVNKIHFNEKEFKALRKDKGLTLRNVEEMTGISNAYLSQLENGKIKKPSYSTVNKLLDLYNNIHLSKNK